MVALSPKCFATVTKGLGGMAKILKTFGGHPLPAPLTAVEKRRATALGLRLFASATVPEPHAVSGAAFSPEEERKAHESPEQAYEYPE